MTAYSLW